MASDLIELRNTVETVLRALCQDGEPQASDVISEVRKQHPNMVRRCSAQLENVGLRQLVNDIRARRPRSAGLQGQPNLPGLPEFIPVPIKQGHRTTFKTELFGSATIRDVKHWLSAQTPTPRPAREAAVVALLEDLKPYIKSESMTVNEAIKARDEQEAQEGMTA